MRRKKSDDMHASTSQVQPNRTRREQQQQQQQQQQQEQPPPQERKKRQTKRPGNPAPGAEVVALTAEELVATNRFFCETCRKGFQREQNLRLHLRGHNIPSELQRRAEGVPPARGRCVYVCPVASCVYHDPARALGDITGIKKHFSRKHGEKRWECERCGRMYALDSDLRAHLKTCRGSDIRCPTCGEDFTRNKELYDEHRETCGALAASAAEATDLNLNIPAPLLSPNHPFPVAGEDDLPPPPPPPPPPAMADPGDAPAVDVPNFLLGFTQLLSSSSSPSCPQPNPNPLDLGIWPSSLTPMERNPYPLSSSPNLSLSSSLLGLSEEERRKKKKNKYVIENPNCPPPPSSSSSSSPFVDYGLMDSIQGPSLSLFGSKLLPFSGPDLSLHTNWSLDPTAAASNPSRPEIGPHSAAQMPPPPPPSSSSSRSFFPQLWSSFRSSEEATMKTTTMTMPTTTMAMPMPTMGFGSFQPWPQPPLMSAPSSLSFGCASGSSNYVGFMMNPNPPSTGGEPCNDAGRVVEAQCEAPPPDVEVYRPTMVDPTAPPSEAQGGAANCGDVGGGPSLRLGGDGERPVEREIDGFTELMLSSFNGEGAFGSDFW